MKWFYIYSMLFHAIRIKDMWKELFIYYIYIFGEIRNNNIPNNHVQLARGSIVKRVNKHWYNSREVVGEENYQSLSNVHECPSSLSLLFPSFPIPSLPVPSLLHVSHVRRCSITIFSTATAHDFVLRFKRTLKTTFKRWRRITRISKNSKCKVNQFEEV